MYRCCSCYGIIADCIRKRSSILERSRVSIVEHSLLQCLLDFDWKALSDTTSYSEAIEVIKKHSSLLEVQKVKRMPLGYVIKWKGECPSCFRQTFEDPPPVQGIGFSNIRPQCSKNWCLLKDVELLDYKTGSMLRKNVRMLIFTVKQVVEDSTGDSFAFRSLDEIEHKNYRTFSELDFPWRDNPDEVHVLLVRSASMGSEALSIIFRSALEDLLGKQK